MGMQIAIAFFVFDHKGNAKFRLSEGNEVLFSLSFQFLALVVGIEMILAVTVAHIFKR